MQEYLSVAQALLKRFTCFQIYYVPREENAMADVLTKFAFANTLMGRALTGHQFEPNTFMIEEDDVNCTFSEANWMTPIRAYLEEGALLDNPVEVKNLRMRVSRYVILRDTLYK